MSSEIRGAREGGRRRAEGEGRRDEGEGRRNPHSPPAFTEDQDPPPADSTTVLAILAVFAYSLRMEDSYEQVTKG